MQVPPQVSLEYQGHLDPEAYLETQAIKGAEVDVLFTTKLKPVLLHSS